jgi:hypothetical protein
MITIIIMSAVFIKLSLANKLNISIFSTPEYKNIMARKPNLAQALANYTKKQSEKTKEKVRSENVEIQAKNRANKAKGKGDKIESSSAVPLLKNDHIPCHIWTDSTHRIQQRTRIPFHPRGNSSVLLIGEGDFSYCRTLVAALGASAGSDERKWRIIATCLDSRETVIRKYRKSSENLKLLEEKESVEVLFGVDGMKLHENVELKRLYQSTSGPTRIIFNFPHTGAGIKDRERNIVAQQKMLQGFFDSVVKFHKQHSKVAKSTCCSYTTTMIKKGRVIDEAEVSSLKRKAPAVQSNKKNKKKGKKSGTESCSEEEEDEDDHLKITNPEFLACNAKVHFDSGDFDGDGCAELDEEERFEVHCTFKTGDPYDSWKPKALAQRTGHLVCQQSFKFVPELYPGYQHCRTIGDGMDVIEVESWKEFLAGKPAKTFVFSFKD